MTSALWLKPLLGFGAAGLAAALVLRSDGGGEAQPPVLTLVLAGSLIAILTTGALYWGVRSDLGLPQKVALYAVGYNVLVVAVKFVLAPTGLYEVNQYADLTGLLPLDDTAGATVTAGFVLALYLAAYVLLYRLARGRVARTHETGHGQRPSAGTVALAVVGGAILVAAAGGLLLVPLLVALTGLEYLQFVFTSSVSLLVGLALAGATALAALAFRSAAERAELVGSAALLVGFFWLGLYFLALYHALWVVYILIAVSIWPLRVVVPK